MPCVSDYIEPTRREVEFQRAAKLIVYVDERLGKTPDPTVVALSEMRQVTVDLIPLLCSRMRSLTEQQLNEIVYDGRNARARDLADWWEEHQVADRIREEQEAREVEREALRKSAAKKLTEEERKALGID